MKKCEVRSFLLSEVTSVTMKDTMGVIKMLNRQLTIELRLQNSHWLQWSRFKSFWAYSFVYAQFFSTEETESTHEATLSCVTRMWSTTRTTGRWRWRTTSRCWCWPSRSRGTTPTIPPASLHRVMAATVAKRRPSVAGAHRDQVGALCFHMYAYSVGLFPVLIPHNLCS